VHEVPTQGVHPDVVPPIAVYATLQPRLVLAYRDKVAITMNGFEHGSHDPCLESIEHRLQVLLKVKERRWRSDGAPTRSLLV
jgi:hypothetical protein